MTSYMHFREWFDGLNAKRLSFLTAFALLIPATVVFGFLPDGGLRIVDAVLSGLVLGICLFVLLVGGKRVDLASQAGAALIAGGLATAIPSLFYEHTPVDWGSALSRLGLLILMVRWGYEVVKRWREERK